MAEFECIAGVSEFTNALDQLTKNIARNVLAGAANAGATVLRKKAVELAPEYEGSDPRPEQGRIKNAIYQARSRERSSDTQQVFIVGVRKGKKSGVKVIGGRIRGLDAYYWTWVEFGHWYVPPRPKGITQKKHRERVKAGPNAIWVEKRPFMGPAYDQAKEDALNAMVEYLRKRVPEEIRKLGLVAA